MRKVLVRTPVSAADAAAIAGANIINGGIQKRVVAKVLKMIDQSIVIKVGAFLAPLNKPVFIDGCQITVRRCADLEFINPRHS